MIGVIISALPGVVVSVFGYREKTHLAKSDKPVVTVVNATGQIMVQHIDEEGPKWAVIEPDECWIASEEGKGEVISIDDLKAKYVLVLSYRSV